MSWFDIVVLISLGFSVIGGLKDGAVKSFLSLIVFLVAVPIAGNYYYFVATLLSFLPADWQIFFGFFATLGLISAVLHIALFLPRKMVEKAFDQGPFRLFGGLMSLLTASLGLVLFALMLSAYPVVDWLVQLVASSAVVAWLVEHLGFVAALLPDSFQKVFSFISTL